MVEAFTAKKLVDVENMKLANEENRLVEEARLLYSVVVVLFVITEEEASSAPFRVRVLIPDLYRDTSPNDSPPARLVEEARDRRASGVVVPSPSLLLALS